MNDDINNIPHDDPRLTAYVLGELDETGRAEIERLIETDPAARLAVDELRSTADLLSAEFKSEPCPSLTDEQRAKIHSAEEAPAPEIRTFKFPRLWIGSGLAAAASLAIAFIVFQPSYRDISSDLGISNQAVQAPAARLELGEVSSDAQLAYGQPDEKSAVVNENLRRVRQLQQEMKYDEALQVVDEILVVDKQNPAALALKDIFEQQRTLMNYALLERKSELSYGEQQVQSREALITPKGNIEYSDDWPSISVRRTDADGSRDSLSDRKKMVADVQGRLALLQGDSNAGVAGDPGAAGATSGSGAVPSTAPTESPSAPARQAAGAGGGYGGGSGGDGGVYGGQAAWKPRAGDAAGYSASRKLDFRKAPDLDLNGALAGVPRSQQIPEPLSPARIEGLSNEGARGRLAELSKAIQLGRVDAETKTRLRYEWDLVLDRLRRTNAFGINTENYALITDNPFLGVTENPLSTFSTDVDTASYSNLRRFLALGALPPPDAVRIEELINYFRYDYAPPAKDAEAPFAAHIEVNSCPWNPAHRLVRVGLKGREVAMDHRPATNLVFLIDVSGSMQPENKLPLLQKSMNLLVDRLNGDDRLAIVTYAGNSGLALPSTYCMDKAAIKTAINALNASGSANGAAGIQLAYDVAAEHLIDGGVNRVILATDGDFNVGISDEGGLVRLIEEKRATGVSLSVLGFGEGNLQDAKMEKLADHGNGNYAYIDSLKEGHKVLVEQATGTLVTIAKDVKIQIEFNPVQVAAYRLIGYENRVLAAQDFNDDRKDAGEIGAGHTVTALYEIVPVGAVAPLDQQIVDLQKQVESIDHLVVTAQLSDAAMKELQQKRTEAENKLAVLKDVAAPQPPPPPVDPLKYQKPAAPAAPAAEPTDAATTGELLTLKLRYKQPEGDISKLIEFPVKPGEASLDSASTDFRFAAAVASFGMILRDSPYRCASNLAAALELAESARGEDEGGYRAEFIELVRKAKALRGE